MLFDDLLEIADRSDMAISPYSPTALIGSADVVRPRGRVPVATAQVPFSPWRFGDGEPRTVGRLHRGPPMPVRMMADLRC